MCEVAGGNQWADSYPPPLLRPTLEMHGAPSRTEGPWEAYHTFFREGSGASRRRPHKRAAGVEKIAIWGAKSLELARKTVTKSATRANREAWLARALSHSSPHCGGLVLVWLLWQPKPKCKQHHSN